MERYTQFNCEVLKSRQIYTYNFNKSHMCELYQRNVEISNGEVVSFTTIEALALVNKWNRATRAFKYWI